MAIDSTLAVRSGLVKLMKASAALVALVPEGRIYSQFADAVPPYPFIKSGSPIGVPLSGSCLDGMEVTVAIHGFATGFKDPDGNIDPNSAEDQAGQIGAAIAAALDKQAFTIPGGQARVRWLGPQLLQDPEEASAFHTIQNFRVRCITA